MLEDSQQRQLVSDLFTPGTPFADPIQDPIPMALFKPLAVIR